MIKKFFVFLVLFSTFEVLSIVKINDNIKNPFQKNRIAKENIKTEINLNEYSLKEIKFLGVIESEKMKLLVVSDPLNKIYHLGVNQIFGRELVQIIDISLEEIFLKFSSSANHFIKENAILLGMIKLKNNQNIFALPLVERNK